MSCANLTCRLDISRLILVSLLCCVIGACGPPWKITGCAQMQLMNISGQPVYAEPRCFLILSYDAALTVVKLYTRDSPGFTCLSNYTCLPLTPKILNYSGNWTNTGLTVVYGCCIVSLILMQFICEILVSSI
ncbi:unnamed protein product [Fasciola hepatica]|uniref:Uncharacterized protein n=1 Tax=Fasciola hepatica TaxID=6192 RepID=A0ABC9HJ09_FASHE